MDRWFLALGAAFGCVAVAAGAFAAHGLQGRLDPKHLGYFQTAAQYQMYHALALLAVAWVCGRGAGWASHAAGWCFLVGILIFSGSLYLLALTGAKWLGAITPIGGIGFLVGWACLTVAALGR